MLRNLRILVLLAAVLLIAATSSRSQTDPMIPDTIYIDSIVSTSEAGGFLPVYFYNDEELGGLEITLTYDSPDIHIDSFSFVNGRLADLTLRGIYSLSPNTITIYCFSFSDVLIPTGQGLLGELHFTFDPGLTAQVVSVDTTSVIIGDRIFSTSFSDGTSTQFNPICVGGYLDIRLGSCCLGDRGNVDGSLDDLITVADLVYMAHYMFHEGPEPPCLEETNIDGSTDERIDVTDILYMVHYFYHDGPPPATCP